MAGAYSNEANLQDSNNKFPFFSKSNEILNNFGDLKLPYLSKDSLTKEDLDVENSLYIKNNRYENKQYYNSNIDIEQSLDTQERKEFMETQVIKEKFENQETISNLEQKKMNQSLTTFDSAVLNEMKNDVKRCCEEINSEKLKDFVSHFSEERPEIQLTNIALIFVKLLKMTNAESINKGKIKKAKESYIAFLSNSEEILNICKNSVEIIFNNIEIAEKFYQISRLYLANIENSKWDSANIILKYIAAIRNYYEYSSKSQHMDAASVGVFTSNSLNETENSLRVSRIKNQKLLYILKANELNEKLKSKVESPTKTLIEMKNWKALKTSKRLSKSNSMYFK